MNKRKKTYFSRHVDRLQLMLNPQSLEGKLSSWILDNTRLAGAPFSFVDHEYQEFILSLNAVHYAIKKPSQIGISELNVRRALGISILNPGVALAYILPTAAFSQRFAKSRVDTVISDSPNVRSQVFTGNDSSVMKQFINNSFIYFFGASRLHQTISTPLDSLIKDELDFFENLDILTQFTSRLTHSKLDKNEFNLSTPTVPGYGISALYDDAKQHVELQKCNHCNHWFAPNYFEDVVLPGFKKPLSTITYATKSLIRGYDLKTAYLSCPRCSRQVDQSIKFRRWVCVNPDSPSDMAGVHITPFTAPNIITPGNLIESATKYSRLADFYNSGLGLDYSDTESEVTLEELQEAVIPAEDITYTYNHPPPYAVMGLDMGGMCACHIGFPSPQGPLLHVHSEQIPLRQLHERYAELCVRFRVICTVADGLPYTDTILSLQNKDPNMWAALFTSSKAVQLYSVQQQEEDELKVFSGVQVVNIARDRSLDQVVAMIRSKNLLFTPSEELAMVFKHIKDMRRVKIRGSDGEERFVWRKSSKGVDHYFFALLYMFMAFCIKGLSGPATMPLPLIHKIRTKGNV